MRQNGLGTLTLDEARTWIEETGLCLFLPKRQFSSSVAPSFVEAVAGRPEVTPEAKTIALAEDLLIRLENEGVAVRLNLQGQPGEQPDFVVAAWVLPYVYALRGDRDWRRSPQLTGSRQVSQLAVHVYKQLESGDQTVSQLKQALGREVSESAVIRAITELWQQLRIIPVIAAKGTPAKWQLLRTRFQRAIAEGASTSQVTAISVLASIYLQAAIAASMEDVEMFLAPLTARSKIREVIRGLVATRQVHTISLGHAPHFYVAGTLPEFEPIATMYASSSMPASTYFTRSFEREDEAPSPSISLPIPMQPLAFQPRPAAPAPPPAPAQQAVEPERHETRIPARRLSSDEASNGSPEHRRTGSNGHSHKPATASRPSQNGSNGHAARRGPDARKARPQSSARPSPGSRWSASKPGNGNGKHASAQAGNGHTNGSHAKNGSSSASRTNGARTNGSHSDRARTKGPGGNGASRASGTARTGAKGNHRPSKPAAASWSKRPAAAKAKPAAARKDVRPTAARKSRPTLTASGHASASGSKRFFNNRTKRGTKKRG
jgi:hypothetical protein